MIEITVTYRGNTVPLQGDFADVLEALDDLCLQDHSLDFYHDFATAQVNDGPVIDLTDESVADAGAFTPVKHGDTVHFYD